MLWPDVRDAQARHSLRQTLLCVRKVLPASAEPLLRADARMLSLDPAQLRVDAALLERRLDDGSREALLAAAALYRGDLLDGLSIDEQPFEHWLTFERERLRAAMANGLARLVNLHSDAGDVSAAISACTQLLQLDPLREDAHRSLMRLHVRQGRRAAALQQYHALVRVLRAELGTLPEAQTQQLYTELESTAPPASLARTETTALADARADAPVPRKPGAVAMVGRAAETAALRAALARAHSEKPSVFLLLGEAGVGKTLLCERFVAAAEAAGTRVLRARCFESEQVLPFALWAGVLRDARVLDDRALLDMLTPALRAELSCLLPEMDAQPADADGAGRARDVLRLFQALQQLMSGLRARAPLMLWLEDLHWADEMSLRMLCFLSRPQTGSRACFVLATAREEAISSASFLRTSVEELDRERLLERCSLGPLSQGDSAELMRSLAVAYGLALPTDARVDQVWAVSEGNPLVIVESMRALAEGAVEQDVTRLPVPERVRAVILGRVGRVSPAARKLLSVSAVVGRELDLGLLRQGTRDEAALVAALEELIASQLLRAVDDRIYFTHDRIRETVYAEMVPTRRRMLHGGVAKSIERRYAGRLDHVFGPLGYHHSKAGNAAASVPYLMRFSEVAWRAHGVGEALAALEQAALDAEQLAPEQRARTAIEIVVRQALCLVFLGRFADLVVRLRAQEQRVADVAQAELTAPFHFWWGFALTMLGEIGAAEQHARTALAHAEACCDARMIGYVNGMLSYLCAVTGRFEQGVRHGSLATDLLARVDDVPEVIGIAWVNLALNQFQLGDWRVALASAERCEAIGHATGSQRMQSMGASGVGFVFAYTQQWERALDAAQRALTASRDPFTLVQALSLLGWAQVGSGQTREAIALLEQVFAQLETHGMRSWGGQVMLRLAEAQLRAGEPTQAERSATQALEIARATGYLPGTAHALRILGQSEQALGRFEAALAHLIDSLQISESVAAPIDVGETLLALAEFARTQSDDATARAHLQRARAIFAAHDADRFLSRIDALSP